MHVPASRFRFAFTASIVMQNFATAWSFSTYVLFLLDHNLSLFDATLLNFLFMSTNVILDPPTGHFADRVGQKKVYLAGMAFWSLAMMIYGTGSMFLQFAAAELTAAVGHSLISGSLDSWLRNNIEEKEAYQAISKAGAYGRLASIPSGFLGGVIGSVYGLSWPWILAGAFSLVALAGSAILLRSLPESHSGGGEKEILPSLQQLLTLSMRHKVLRLTIVVALVSTFAVQPYNMFWAPVLRDLSGESWWLGSIWAGMAAFIALGSYLATKFPSGGKNRLVVSVVFLGLPMLFTPLVGNAAAVVGLILLHEIGRGSITPLLFAYANKHIEGSSRSTLNSVRSGAGTLGAAIGLLFFGYLTIYFPPRTIWGLAAICLLLLALWTWRKEV